MPFSEVTSHFTHHPFGSRLRFTMVDSRSDHPVWISHPVIHTRSWTSHTNQPLLWMGMEGFGIAKPSEKNIFYHFHQTNAHLNGSFLNNLQSEIRWNRHVISNCLVDWDDWLRIKPPFLKVSVQIAYDRIYSQEQRSCLAYLTGYKNHTYDELPC